MFNHKFKADSVSAAVEKILNEARIPLEGHPYHKKSDAELKYIQKDAGQSARDFKGYDPKAEAKYLDQVNDATTILYHRKQGGVRQEEVEQIDELSKGTLDSYRKKNSDEYVKHMGQAAAHVGKGTYDTPAADTLKAKMEKRKKGFMTATSKAVSSDAHERLAKRRTKQAMAYSKANEEVEQIDLDETIRRIGDQYRLISGSGKNLGTSPTKAGAEKREREVEYFKHKKD